MNTPVRTRAAVVARAHVIDRFGMDKSAPFVEVARRLIDEDHLLVEADVSTRSGACAFLQMYWQTREYRQIKPLPKEFWT